VTTMRDFETISFYVELRHGNRAKANLVSDVKVTLPWLQLNSPTMINDYLMYVWKVDSVKFHFLLRQFIIFPISFGERRAAPNNRMA